MKKININKPEAILSSINYELKDKTTIIVNNFIIKKGPNRQTIEGNVTYFLLFWTSESKYRCSNMSF